MCFCGPTNCTRNTFVIKRNTVVTFSTSLFRLRSNMRSVYTLIGKLLRNFLINSPVLRRNSHIFRLFPGLLLLVDNTRPRRGKIHIIPPFRSRSPLKT